MNETQSIHNEILALKKDVKFLKEHMADKESILTEGDYLALQEYRKEKSTGKLKSHDELKQELDV